MKPPAPETGPPAGDLQAAEAKLHALLQPSMPAAEVAAALETIGRDNLSARRRLQAELLHRRLTELAELASSCGWGGAAVVKGGEALIEHDGVLARADRGQFRTSGHSPAEVLISTLEHFAIRPRVIVDLQAGAGEIAILLARRYPKCRVIAAGSSRPQLEAFDDNLALQARPVENLEIAPLAADAGSETTLRSMFERGAVRRIDLLRCQARPDGAGLAATIRAMAGRITMVCLTLSGEARQHADLLSALGAAGLVMLEKRSQPIAEPGPWLESRLTGKAPVTCWFVARGSLDQRRRPLRALLNLLEDPGRSGNRLKAWFYGVLDSLRKRVDPTDRRFEFEKLYTLKPDPWRYRSNIYETLKYQRTLRTALRLRPQADAVLEIGCSIGLFTRMLARSFPEVTAVDLSSEALKIARREASRMGLVSYVRSDVRNLSLPRRHGLILCAEMLYYLPDDHALQVIAMLERSLAPSGLVMIVNPRPDDFGVGLPTASWGKRLMDSGFRIVSQENFEDPFRAYLIQAFEREASLE